MRTDKLPSINWIPRFTLDDRDSGQSDLRVVCGETLDHPQGPLTLATINVRAFAPHVHHAVSIAQVMAASPQLLNACQAAADYLAAIDEMQPDKRHGKEGARVRALVNDAIKHVTETLQTP